jgi:hypothetical protein
MRAGLELPVAGAGASQGGDGPVQQPGDAVAAGRHAGVRSGPGSQRRQRDKPCPPVPLPAGSCPFAPTGSAPGCRPQGEHPLHDAVAPDEAVPKGTRNVQQHQDDERPGQELVGVRLPVIAPERGNDQEAQERL